jgi:tRNA dimethylallyltransferase
VVAIVGPTASGKTSLAEHLGAALDGEVVSADSMQVYRGMDIGTAKPPEAARRVRHWCVDLVDPGEAYSAAVFQTDARRAIADIQARGKVPIVAGGTGLYVRAALDEMEFPAGEQEANPVRAHYEALAADAGPEALHALLAARDPESASVIHPNNLRRVVRALEMHDAGISYAHQLAGFSARRSAYDTSFIGLDVRRERLYELIEARVDAMIAAGLLDEVERLLGAGLREALTASQAIGYKEFVPVIEEGADLDEAIAAVKRATRRYAKRQLTWFHADPRVRWIDVTDLTETQAADAAMRTLDCESTHG